jgi:hypothetical protein
MIRTRWLAGLATVVLGCAAAIGAQDRQGSAAALRKPMALVGGMLIDGAGGPPIRNSVVLIRGDRIEKVGDVSSLPVPGGYDQISTEGMTAVGSGDASRDRWSVPGRRRARRTAQSRTQILDTSEFDSR